jgi:hypothetical protein
MFIFQFSYGIGDNLGRSYFDLSIIPRGAAAALENMVTLFANLGENLTATNVALG